MASILEGELAATIADALLDADIPFTVTVSRTVLGEVDPETPWIEPEEVTTHYACKGFVETFSSDYIAGGLVEANDVKIIILPSTLSITVELTDHVTARGIQYSIVNISTDPALATVELQARR